MLADLFLDKGANPNMIAGADCAEPGKTPLELALVHYFQYNDPTIMTLLMEHGANTNYRVDKEFIPGPPFFQDRAWNGITPLLFAVESDFVKPVQILLSHGADPCLPRTDGTLPIEIATEHHYKAIMSLLRKSMSGLHCEASVKNPDTENELHK